MSTAPPSRSFTLFFLATALLGGLLAELVGLPGAWMLGPLIVAVLWALRGVTAPTIAPPLYLAAQAVLGAATSASFTPTTVALLGSQALTLTLLVGLLLGMSALIALALARLSGLDRRTALIGMLPGGAPTMVALSEALDADTRVVTVMQYGRLLLVLLLMGPLASLVQQLAATPAPAQAAPALGGGAGAEELWLAYGVTLASALLGAWLGLWARLPGGAVVGPALLGAAFGAADIPHGLWPPGVLEASFLVIGVRVGARFDREALRRVRRLLPALAACMAVLIAGSALLGWGFAAISGVDLLSAYLATTPGGLDTAVALALDTQTNAALVIAVNMARFLAITLLAPPLLRRLVAARAQRGLP